MRYLEIENGIAINCIEAEPNYIKTLPGTYVQSDECDIGFFYDGTNFTFPEIKEEEETEESARIWRNFELDSTDHIVPLTDHPDHAATLAYRATLRDWPSTSDFPDTKPTL